MKVLEKCPDFLYLSWYINKAENLRELKSFEEMPFNPKPEKITVGKLKLFTKKKCNLKWPEKSQCPLLWAASFTEREATAEYTKVVKEQILLRVRSLSEVAEEKCANTCKAYKDSTRPTGPKIFLLLR